MQVNNCRILNIDINNVSFNDFLTNLSEGVVVTPNADHLIKLQKDQEFYNCYLNAEHIVCDSRIVLLLSKILHPRNPLKSQIAGSDLFPAYCQHHSKNEDVKIFLLGGTEASAKKAAENINNKCEREIISGYYSPPFGFENNSEESEKIISLVEQSGANVLAVGVGAPKQEKWIYAHREELNTIKLFFAIGATIEFEAGGMARAPEWMSKYGLEWAFRMSQEPGRLIKRYLIDDIPIFWLVLRQKFGFYKNPWEKQDRAS